MIAMKNVKEGVQPDKGFVITQLLVSPVLETSFSSELVTTSIAQVT